MRNLHTTATCQHCGKAFHTTPSKLESGHGKFCSNSCYHAHPRPIRPIDVFWTRVDKSGDCWLWTGGRSADGYGWFHHNRESRYAHRVAYELCKGPIPAGMLVCHTCDNPPCCNPDHLFLGDERVNAGDMMTKGRGRSESHPGERNGNAVLTPDKVREIRRLAAEGVTWKSIGARFGVSKSAVMMVVTGRNWKHV